MKLQEFSDKELCGELVICVVGKDLSKARIVKDELQRRGIFLRDIVIEGKFRKHTPSVITELSATLRPRNLKEVL